MKVLIVPPTGDMETRTLSGTLLEYQQAVGGFIEVIPLIVDGLQGIIDEEGKLKSLAFNERATLLSGLALGGRADYVVGNMLVIGSTDEEGEFTGITDEQSAALMNQLERL